LLGVSGPVVDGRQIHLSSYWRVEELAAERHEWYVTPFYHLINPAWQIVANQSPHGQWGYEWVLGDVYVQRQTLTVPDEEPAGTYRLHLGLFDPIQQRGFNLNSPTAVEPYWFTTVVIE
jgi:hypothetical protein